MEHHPTAVSAHASESDWNSPLPLRLLAAGDELPTFSDEGDDAAPPFAAKPWKILVVDDDASVHAATLHSLSGVRIAGRDLEFMHAYSAAEARRAIEATTDIAVLLLECVMETPEAGLHRVREIRDEMGLADLRIVLRTGQPGCAPAQRVMRALPSTASSSRATSRAPS